MVLEVKLFNLRYIYDLILVEVGRGGRGDVRAMENSTDITFNDRFLNNRREHKDSIARL